MLGRRQGGGSEIRSVQRVNVSSSRIIPMPETCGQREGLPSMWIHSCLPREEAWLWLTWGNGKGTLSSEGPSERHTSPCCLTWFPFPSGLLTFFQLLTLLPRLRDSCHSIVDTHIHIATFAKFSILLYLLPRVASVSKHTRTHTHTHHFF